VSAAPAYTALRATVRRVKPLFPREISAIEHELFVESVSELYRTVLVVRFRGEHRGGAEGASDARAVEAWIGFAVTLVAPDALVIDLSGLRFSGPLPRHVLNPVEPNLEEGFPLFVVGPAEARGALAALPAESICASLDEAFERIRRAGPWAIR
jgi:hypothetical protein